MNLLRVYFHCLYWSVQPWRWTKGVSHRHCTIQTEQWKHHYCECGYDANIFGYILKAKQVKP